MKIKYKTKVGSYTIIHRIDNAIVDNERTRSFIAQRITPGMSNEDIENLYKSNLQYAFVGSEGELISDTLGDQLQQRLDERGKYQQLLDTGEYIDDFRDVKFWMRCESGRWMENSVSGLGEVVPKEGLVPDMLDDGQRREIELEIAAQNEADRIAALTPEQKAEEKKLKLYVLAREALQKAEEAELLGYDFDKLEWIQPKKAEVEALYA